MNKIDVKSNRYYVGAKHISDSIKDSLKDSWTHETLAGAIKHAKELMEEESDRELVHIVQIVSIVRRAKTPIIVDKV